MELQIEQGCPSCGASIVLDEDDRLIQCPFCDLLNYRLATRGLRYRLAAALPSHIDEAQLIHVPFIRFKGAVYNVNSHGVTHRLVDTTRAGMELTNLPVSLGLRPQAMKLQPVISATPGLFLHQSIPSHDVFKHAVLVTEVLAQQETQPILHRAFIGETVSRIYQPYYLDNGQLLDAVTRRPVGPATLLEAQLLHARPSQKEWEPQFASTACPGCGGLMTGKKDSLVLICSNCNEQWQEGSGRFEKIDWGYLVSKQQAPAYLPFWQIYVRDDGNRLASFADLIRFTNQPMVALKKYELLPLFFFIPAFKINPRAFLQIASQMTVLQHKFAAILPDADQESGMTAAVLAHNYPVTLEEQEAIQALKSVLAAMTVDKRNSLPRLPLLNLTVMRIRLLYLPFFRQAHDCVQEQTGATILTAALKYGRYL